jgi:hypothetical protein
LKTLLACLLSSFVVAIVVGTYSVAENGLRIEIFGLLLIVFLYAFAVALVIGLPFHYVARRLGKANGICYAAAGALVGATFFLGPLIASRGTDPSFLKLALTLSVAGFLAGWTFHQTLRA